jgi:hypothetical protein
MKREVDFKALKHVSYRKDVSKIDVGLSSPVLEF